LVSLESSLISTSKRCDYSISVEYSPLSLSGYRGLPRKKGHERGHTSGSRRSNGATSQAEEGLYAPTLQGESIASRSRIEIHGANGGNLKTGVKIR
jgi:hypothetical protein